MTFTCNKFHVHSIEIQQLGELKRMFKDWKEMIELPLIFKLKIWSQTEWFIEVVWKEISLQTLLWYLKIQNQMYDWCSTKKIRNSVHKTTHIWKKKTTIFPNISVNFSNTKKKTRCSWMTSNKIWGKTLSEQIKNNNMHYYTDMWEKTKHILAWGNKWW